MPDTNICLHDQINTIDTKVCIVPDRYSYEDLRMTNLVHHMGRQTSVINPRGLFVFYIPATPRFEFNWFRIKLRSLPHLVGHNCGHTLHSLGILLIHRLGSPIPLLRHCAQQGVPLRSVTSREAIYRPKYSYHGRLLWRIQLGRADMQDVTSSAMV